MTSVICGTIATVAWRRCRRCGQARYSCYAWGSWAVSLQHLGTLRHTAALGVFPLTFRETARMDSGISDENYQDQILPHVSRTFALTIPQLPESLRVAVTNAYLLCRIADTIEDEPAVPPRGDAGLSGAVQGGRRRARRRGAAGIRRGGTPVEPHALDRTRPHRQHGPRAERHGIAQPPQRAAIQRCVDLMCYGMPRFQSTASLSGCLGAPIWTSIAIMWRAWSARCSRSCFASTPRAPRGIEPSCKVLRCPSPRVCK